MAKESIAKKLIMYHPLSLVCRRVHENHEKERGDPLCSDILEWLQEFRENLVDDRVPEHRDSWIIFGAYACEKCGFG